jgi:hypothetical protein
LQGQARHVSGGMPFGSSYGQELHHGCVNFQIGIVFECFKESILAGPHVIFYIKAFPKTDESQLQKHVNVDIFK